MMIMNMIKHEMEFGFKSLKNNKTNQQNTNNEAYSMCKNFYRYLFIFSWSGYCNDHFNIVNNCHYVRYLFYCVHKKCL